jgi:hypothetical protein
MREIPVITGFLTHSLDAALQEAAFAVFPGSDV